MSLIKVLVIEESDMLRKGLTAMLRTAPDIEIIGAVDNCEDAQDSLGYLAPDVVLLGHHAGSKGFIECIYRLRSATHAPLVVYGSHIDDPALVKSAEEIQHMELLEIGGSGSSFLDELQSALLESVHHAAVSQLVEAPASRRIAIPVNGDIAVAIGASTGGQNALIRLAPHFPPDFPAAILVAQASRPGFTRILAERIGHVTRLPVREAQDGDKIFPGEIYILPGGMTAVVEEEHIKAKRLVKMVIHEATGPGMQEHIADRLMGSVASVYGSHAIGVVLTGLGQDGVVGLKAIRAAGGVTFAEDASTAVVYDLPAAAVAEHVVDKTVPLWFMAEEIRKAVKAMAERYALPSGL